MVSCKSCGAALKWIKTKNGKSMPCDAQAVVYSYKSDANGVIVTADGEVLVKCVIGAEATIPSGVGYIPHWSTCPNADNHRKK